MKSVLIVSVIFAIIAVAASQNTNYEVCADVPAGVEHYMINIRSCASYWRCVDGVGYEGACPGEFWFNYDTQMCDYPVNVDCASRTTTEQPTEEPTEPATDTTTPSGEESTTDDFTTTEAETTETTEGVTEAPSVCFGLDNGVLVGSEDSCGEFFHCVDYEAYLNTCPEGLLFNGVYCDLESRVSCGYDSTEAPTTEPTETETVTDEPTTADPGTESTDSTTGIPGTEEPSTELCPPDHVGLHPHSTSCSKYYLCFNGEQVEFQCNAGDHFSKEKLACVPRATTNCRLEDPFCDPELSADRAIYLAHPHFCEQFFVCFRGNLVSLSCADGDHWDNNTGWCIPKDESSCVA